jgi:HSP20 family protein
MTKVAVQGFSVPKTDHPTYEAFMRRLDAVRERAFEMFERRGSLPGREFEDWVSAEHEVMGWPTAELREIGAEYELDLTLPGFSPEEIEVTATPAEVLVHACTERRESARDEGVVWSEFSNNEIFRRFVLPKEITPEGVTAQLSDGVLHLHAPRAAAAASNGPKEAAPVT